MNSDSRNGVQRQAVLAHRLHDDVVLDELDAGLGEVADALRCLQRILAAGEQEDDDADERGEDGDERRPC